MKSYGLAKRATAVLKCRDITKRDMKHNTALPKMKGEICTHCIGEFYMHLTTTYSSPHPVDPETYEVRADGELCDVEPALTLPLTKQHMVF
jgi:urease